MPPKAQSGITCALSRYVDSLECTAHVLISTMMPERSCKKVCDW